MQKLKINWTAMLIKAPPNEIDDEAAGPGFEPAYPTLKT